MPRCWDKRAPVEVRWHHLLRCIHAVSKHHMPIRQDSTDAPLSRKAASLAWLPGGQYLHGHVSRAHAGQRSGETRMPVAKRACYLWAQRDPSSATLRPPGSG